MDINEQMRNQLAIDFNTTPDALMAGRNVFTLKQSDPQKRAYENGEAMLQILCINGIAVFSAMDKALLDALRQAFEHGDSAWLLEIDSLRKLDGMLKPFGHVINSYHQYYVPGKDLRPARQICPVKWYRDEELKQFADDPRFDEALGGNPAWPDKLAVAALDGDDIIGMAAASMDSANMWQIGINVESAARGRGIATMLVTLMRDELMRMGIVPFYGTAASHILSQRVAVASGFMPAWAEMYTSRLT